MQRNGFDSSIADLLEGAVHDLKGPAARLRLGSQLLNQKSAALDEDARTLLKHMEDSAAAVGVVAEGLKRYAEICAHPLRREPVELGLLVSASTANLQREIANAGAQVACSVLPLVYADRFLMTWLFEELLTNSLHFGAANSPEVRISTAMGGPGNWYVAVSDNGPGIEPGLEDRVFLPFKRLSVRSGAGLGLTICRKIIELHRGKMWIEPGGRGAEFRFFVGGDDKVGQD